MKEEFSAENQASAWIQMTEIGFEKCPDELFDQGFSLNSRAYDDPEFAWDVILLISEDIRTDELLANSESRSTKLASNLGAGPLETLLAQHGADFIERVERRAKEDEKFKWIVGCVARNAMEERIWRRVKEAAGNISR